MSSLQSSVVLGPAGPVVVLAGEADAQSAGQLREVLVSQLWRGGRRLVVDVSQLRYVDSESVRVLAVAAKMLREQNGELVLWRPQTAVAKLLDLMGANRVITVEEPSDEMLRAEAGAPAAISPAVSMSRWLSRGSPGQRRWCWRTAAPAVAVAPTAATAARNRYWVPVAKI